ncbi:hypothetical protein BE17_20560 [Sorangium cellulosum]|uniref:Uncharacterized protein n=1 Tax=Sorangium cellulosum TaxID=56 RepID=A0A150RLC2_SORCE|nr:hypothetical protein BE17_20560 [Sorangium cellulosum]
MTGSGKPGPRIVSRKTRAGIPVTDSTFFCESISGGGAVSVSPSSGIASVAVAVTGWASPLGGNDPRAGTSGNVLSTTRKPCSA